MNTLPSMPLLMRCFVGFCLVTSIHTFLGFIPAYRDMSSALIPYIGWSYGSAYLFALIFIGSTYFARGHRPIPFILGIFPLIHLIQGAFDLSRTLSDGSPNTENPYLWVHPNRPLFTIVIPAIWVFILGLPHIHDWYRAVRSSLVSR